MRIQHNDKTKYTLKQAWFLFGKGVKVWRGPHHMKVILTVRDDITERIAFEHRDHLIWFRPSEVNNPLPEFVVLSYVQPD